MNTQLIIELRHSIANSNLLSDEEVIAAAKSALATVDNLKQLVGLPQDATDDALFVTVEALETTVNPLAD